MEFQIKLLLMMKGLVIHGLGKMAIGVLKIYFYAVPLLSEYYFVFKQHQKIIEHLPPSVELMWVAMFLDCFSFLLPLLDKSENRLKDSSSNIPCPSGQVLKVINTSADSP